MAKELNIEIYDAPKYYNEEDEDDNTIERPLKKKTTQIIL